MSIKENWQKIKAQLAQVGTELFLVGLIAAVGFSAFGLGRLSVPESTPIPAVSLIQAPTFSTKSLVTTPGRDATLAPAGNLVASRNGSKYHFPWCPGAQRMKESNKIWFADEQTARAAGYLPAANCKGLE
mgnify:CR=1 FL=1